jgi:hypothetical protein
LSVCRQRTMHCCTFSAWQSATITINACSLPRIALIRKWSQAPWTWNQLAHTTTPDTSPNRTTNFKRMAATILFILGHNWSHDSCIKHWIIYVSLTLRFLVSDLWCHYCCVASWCRREFTIVFINLEFRERMMRGWYPSIMYYLTKR